MLDPTISGLLEHYITDPPHTKDAWYGPWTAILSSLFPTTEGFVVLPQTRTVGDDHQSLMSNFVIEVARVTSTPFTRRTVYGEAERNGTAPVPLIDWYDTTHDEASFQNLQTLSQLVRSL